MQMAVPKRCVFHGHDLRGLAEEQGFAALFRSRDVQSMKGSVWKFGVATMQPSNRPPTMREKERKAVTHGAVRTAISSF